MAGEAEIRAIRSQSGVQIVDIRCVFIRKWQTVTDETQIFQGRLQYVQRTGIVRRDASAADQVPGKVYRVDDGISPAKDRLWMFSTASVRPPVLR